MDKVRGSVRAQGIMAIFMRSDWLPYLLGISLDVHCFGMRFKMASCFATVFRDEILSVNEEAAPTNTKEETTFSLLVFTGRKKKISH